MGGFPAISRGDFRSEGLVSDDVLVDQRSEVVVVVVVVVPDRVKYKFSDYWGMLLRSLQGKGEGRKVESFFPLSIPFQRVIVIRNSNFREVLEPVLMKFAGIDYSRYIG